MTGSLSDIITSTDPAARDQALERLCRPASRRALLAECAALDAFRRQQRQPLRARPGAVLPLRHPPISSARQAEAAPRGRGDGSDSLSRLRAFAAAPFRGGHRSFSPCSSRRAQRRDLQRPGGRVSRLGFQTLADQVRRSVRRCAAINGCSAWAIQPISRCASALSCSTMPGDGTFPVLRERTPVRMDLTPCGVERHLLSGHGFPGRRTGPERLG